MSAEDKRRVICDTHGETVPTFVCKHLVGGSELGFYSAYDEDDEEPDEYPNAWCAACEAARIREGGESGDWNEASEAFAGVTLVCAGCYVAARERNEQLDDDDGDEDGSSAAFHCATCGQEHVGLPDMGADMPDAYFAVPKSKRRKLRVTDDTCVIPLKDGNAYFIRGVIEIPIRGRERFGFGVWVSLKKENFETYVANFNSAEIGPFFGWLCTELSFYSAKTTSLKTMVHFRGGGLRPTIKLELASHPLAMHQHFGISLAKALEIVHHYDPA